LKKRHSVVPAVYLIPRKGSEILLLKRKNTGFADGMYSFIAGHVEKGESFHSAVIREAREEAGIEIIEKDLKFKNILHRNSDDYERIDVFFEITNWEKEIVNKEPQKCEELIWVDKDNLPLNTIDYIVEIIKKLDEEALYSHKGW